LRPSILPIDPNTEFLIARKCKKRSKPDNRHNGEANSPVGWQGEGEAEQRCPHDDDTVAERIDESYGSTRGFRAAQRCTRECRRERDARTEADHYGSKDNDR
jgi:hypothetical protein